MDDDTLESLADLICGDDAGRIDSGPDRFSPVYRTGSQLTQFFERAGLPRFRHDGSTRKWWTLDALRQCSPPKIDEVICRLANPKEYSANAALTSKAHAALNHILRLEGRRVRLNGIVPVVEQAPIEFSLDEAKGADLKPLPPPDFLALGLEPGIGDLLAQRWEEAQRCVECKTHLAAIVMMGSLLEGMLLAVMQRNPQPANRASSAPKDPHSGKSKHFADWTLSQMIDVAHEIRWIDMDVQRFSHALRWFRNLIHPYEQMLAKTQPDADTCVISWLVVQAATNDLARALQANAGKAV